LKSDLVFQNPPVVELALAVQFVRLEKLRSPQMGLLWQELKRKYPKFEELAELPPMEDALSGPNTEVRIVEEDSLARRVWFLNEEGTDLLQIQRDRIAHNWRRLSDESPYPSFQETLAVFQEEFAHFEDFSSRMELGPVSADRCELTYVDHIDVGDRAAVRTLGSLGDLLGFWQRGFSVKALGEPRFAACQLRFRSEKAAGSPAIDVLVEVSPARYLQGHRNILLMKTIAQGAASGENWEAVNRFMNEAHDLIQDCFLSITTREIQDFWKGVGR
jgi:uncharacterized protein (TIGR04255 family)